MMRDSCFSVHNTNRNRGWKVFTSTILLVSLILSTSHLHGQDHQSSDQHAKSLAQAKISALCLEARKIASSDTSKALQKAKQALALAKRIGDVRGMALSYNSVAYVYHGAHKWDAALWWYRYGLKHYRMKRDKTEISKTLRDIGDVQRFKNDLKNALISYGEALDLSESSDNSSLRASIRFGIAAVHSLSGRPFEAIQWYRNGAEVARMGNECTCEASCLNNMGYLFAIQGEYDSAMFHYRRALEIAKNLGEDERVLQYRMNIACTYFEMGDINVALDAFAEAFADAARINSIDMMWKARQNIAEVLLEIGNYSKAIETFQYCLILSGQSAKFRTRKNIEIYNCLGDAYLATHRYADAMDCYRHAAEISANENATETPTPWLHTNIGKVYAEVHRYSPAKESFRKAITLYEQVRERPKMALAMLGLGDVLAMEDSTNGALKLFENVLEIGKDIKNPSIKGKAQLRISKLLLDRGDLLRADPHIKAAVRSLRDQDDPKSLAEALCLKAGIELRANNLARAGALLNEAEEIASVRYIADIAPTIMEYQEELAKRRGNVNEAYSLLRRRWAIEDSLNHVRSTARFEYLLVEYEAERKDHELSLLKERQKLHASELERETLLRNVVIGAAILLLIIGLLIYRRMRDRRRTVELRAQAAEATALSAETEKLRVLAEAERREKETQQLFSRQLLNAQEEERKRIAGELHDSLSQDLIVVKNRLLLLRETTGLNGDLNDAIEGVGETLDDVRRLSRDLRPSQLDRYGIRKALRSLVRRVDDSTPVNFTFEIGDVDGLWNKDAEASIYRIVQEGINNILRHAEAENARISLMPDTDTAVLSIEDDGKGLPEIQGTAEQTTDLGFGLRNMKERASILGGKMNLSSQPDHGTRIEILLPLSNANREPDVSMQEEMEQI